MAVHHVHMDHVGPALLDSANVLAQPGEVRGQNGWSDFDFCVGHGWPGDSSTAPKQGQGAVATRLPAIQWLNLSPRAAPAPASDRRSSRQPPQKPPGARVLTGAVRLSPISPAPR